MKPLFKINRISLFSFFVASFFSGTIYSANSHADKSSDRSNPITNSSSNNRLADSNPAAEADTSKHTTERVSRHSGNMVHHVDVWVKEAGEEGLVLRRFSGLKEKIDTCENYALRALSDKKLSVRLTNSAGAFLPGKQTSQSPRQYLFEVTDNLSCMLATN